MDVDALVAAVIADTKRPDKESLIERYVRAAILKCHEIDFFPEDLILNEGWIPSPTGTTVTLDVPDFWRKFAVIYPTNSSGASLDRSFELDESGQIDTVSADYRQTKEFYRVAGTSVVLTSYTTIEQGKWTYWAYPDLTDGAAETWLMAKYPQAVIDLATFYIEIKLGNTAVGQINNNLWTQLWRPEILKNHFKESL